jgi:hypothetical protein
LGYREYARKTSHRYFRTKFEGEHYLLLYIKRAKQLKKVKPTYIETPLV